MTTAAPLTTTTAFHAAAPKATVNNTSSSKNPTVIPSGDVSATLYFHGGVSNTESPYNYVCTPPPGVPQNNIIGETRETTIHDFRGFESEFGLNKQAFAALSNVPSVEKEFVDDEKIKSNYYREVIDLVKEKLAQDEGKTKADYEVVIFDHTIRRNVEGAARKPVPRVHIDQTEYSANLRVKKHLSESRSSEVLSQNIRQRIINVWRPINGPVVDYPLAFADSSTVPESDVLPVRHIYEDWVGETAAVKYSEGQKWWYWSGMKNDEVLLIKCSDTDVTVGGGAEGRRGRTPHTAFAHPETPEGAKGRESIEVRCLVIG